jgi:hypothetical protein
MLWNNENKARLWWATPFAFALLSTIWVPTAVGLVLVADFLMWEPPSLDVLSYMFWVRLGLVATAADTFIRLRRYYAD